MIVTFYRTEVIVDPAFRQLDGPLATVGVSAFTEPSRHQPSAESDGELTPFALLGLLPAPLGSIPSYRFDPVKQAVAADEDAQPQMKKDWTTVEGTHTDGDGGDNESWGWEEV